MEVKAIYTGCYVKFTATVLTGIDLTRENKAKRS